MVKVLNLSSIQSREVLFSLWHNVLEVNRIQAYNSKVTQNQWGIDRWTQIAYGALLLLITVLAVAYYI